ncbi:hypothetical protein ACTFIY_010001 [Dictyostelium cf. discoideum]
MSTTNTNNLFSYEKYTKPEGYDYDECDYSSEGSDNNDYPDNESFTVNKNYKNNGGGGASISKPKKKQQQQQQQQPSQEQEQQQTLETSENLTPTTTTEKSSKTNKKQNKHEELNETIEETNKTKKLTKSEVQSIIDDEIENKKKERLPSSEEVYNRILYDHLLKDKMDDFTIFYEDRFDGLKRAAFKSFEFGVVPLHRIKKISYLNTIVWDRIERIYDFSIFDCNNNENNNNNNNNNENNENI